MGLTTSPSGGGSTDLHSPGPIGDVTPSTIAGTRLTIVDVTYEAPTFSVTSESGVFRYQLGQVIAPAFYCPGTSLFGTLSIGVEGDTTLTRAAAGCAVVNGPFKLKAYTVGTLPTAATYVQGIIYVSDGTGNKRLAISDGSAWRFPDGNIVS